MEPWLSGGRTIATFFSPLLFGGRERRLMRQVSVRWRDGSTCDSVVNGLFIETGWACYGNTLYNKQTAYHYFYWLPLFIPTPILGPIRLTTATSSLCGVGWSLSFIVYRCRHIVNVTALIHLGSPLGCSSIAPTRTFDRAAMAVPVDTFALFVIPVVFLVENEHCDAG
eukprot:scaffold37878_cov107-Attheya_sp.AAC.3